MKTRTAIGLGAVAMVAIGFWFIRPAHPDSAPLVIRRTSPTEPVLTGSPNLPVLVDLELINTTQRPIELAPLEMPCSCQIAKPPAELLLAGGRTTASLSLRYPPALRTVIPVEFKTPTGELLARTEIVLEADRQVPYFMSFPERVEIPVIDGVSDGTWEASATAVEFEKEPPYVKGVRVVDGADLVRISLTKHENAVHGMPECQRTYRLTFELQGAALNPSGEPVPLHGFAVLDLRDGTERRIMWTATRQAPLAMLFDTRSGNVRGVRRAGARGSVTLRCLPEGSGTLTPDQFDAGQPVVAALKAGSVKPESIEAYYQADNSVVRMSLPIR